MVTREICQPLRSVDRYKDTRYLQKENGTPTKDHPRSKVQAYSETSFSEEMNRKFV